MTGTPASLEDTLKAAARSLGFDAAGIARADEAWEAGARLAAFVAEGRHGGMRDAEFLAGVAEISDHSGRRAEVGQASAAV